MSSKRFNIRVYGLLINDKDQVLVSDECRNGFSFTKFPGGGLEFGEGFTECLCREFKEEMDVDVQIGELYFYNDYFQESIFNPNDQIISFYYKVNCDSWESIIADKHVHPITVEGEKNRWVNISELSEVDFALPIDKLVISKMREL